MRTSKRTKKAYKKWPFLFAIGLISVSLLLHFPIVIVAAALIHFIVVGVDHARLPI